MIRHRRQPSTGQDVLDPRGLVAAAVALGVAELVAGLNRAWRSPVLDVGDRVIDAAPPFVKEFAIDTFGTNDKPALLIGIGVFLAVYAAMVGVVALRHRFVVGVVGIGLFGVIGVVGGGQSARRRTVARRAAQRDRRSGRDRRAWWLVDRSVRAPVAQRQPRRATRSARTGAQFLHRSGALLGGLAVGAAAARRASAAGSGRRFTAAESRAGVALPRAGRAARRAAAGRQVDVAGHDAVRHAERPTSTGSTPPSPRRRCRRTTTRCASRAWSTTSSSCPTTTCCAAR